MVYIPSDDGNTGGGVSCSDIALLNVRSAALADYVNQVGGSLLSLTLE